MRIPVTQQLCCVRSIDVVHRNPQLPVVFSPVVDSDDVRMPERCGNVGFTSEAVAEMRVGADVFRKDLERLQTRQPRMFHEVDLAHSAPTQ